MNRLQAMIHNEQKTKLQQFLITMLAMTLILVLVLSVPIRTAEAISEIAVGAIYFVCATIFSSMSINLVSNDNAQQKFADWFYSCCSETQQAIRTAAGQLPASIINNSNLHIGTCKITFDAESWSFICEDVRKYINRSYHDVSKDVVSGSDGTLGFTPNSQFSCSVPGGLVQITLTDNCVLTLDGIATVPYSFSQLPYTLDSYLDLEGSYKDKYGRGTIFSVVPFGLHFYDYSLTTKNFDWLGSISSDVELGYKSSNRISFTLDSSVEGMSKTSHNFLNVCSYSYRYTTMYTINNQLCYFQQCTDNKYRFVPFDLFSSSKSSATDETCVPLVNNLSGDTYYSFSDRNEMYYTVLDGAGLRHYTDSQKNESETDVFVPYVPPFTNNIPDVYNGSQSVGLTIPDTVSGVDDITGVMEADVVTEYVNSAEYPDGVPEIDSSGLFDKFPFCLPVDIYNLFANFYSVDTKAPKFTIPIRIGQQSDGSYFVDYDIEVDLSFLDSVVPVFRFGVSISFVLALILITRKMIGAQ